MSQKSRLCAKIATLMPNQNPEQIARDKIDKLLIECGWIVQSKKDVNLNAGLSVAVREYQTDVGPETVDSIAAKHIETGI